MAGSAGDKEFMIGWCKAALFFIKIKKYFPGLI